MQTESGSLKTVSEFEITIEQLSGFEFRVRFDKEQYPELRMDEPQPLGLDSAPNPARVLAAAIGNCLSASFVFCAQKSRVQVGPVYTTVRTRIGRNSGGRLRIERIDVEIDPGVPEADREKALRCLGLFEDYCVVTQSVRQGLDVNVSVKGFESAPPAGG